MHAAHQARREGGAQTRQRLLDTAEDLFSRVPIEAVSVRSINAAAGFAPAAINYHFGTKERLLRAVIARRGTEVLALTLSHVEALESRPDVPSTVGLVTAIANPLFAVVDAAPIGGASWVRLTARLSQARDPLIARPGEPDQLDARILAQVTRRYPNTLFGPLESRWRLAIFAMMSTIGDGVGTHDRDVVVQFIASGFDAIMATAPTICRQTPRQSPSG